MRKRNPPHPFGRILRPTPRRRRGQRLLLQALKVNTRRFLPTGPVLSQVPAKSGVQRRARSSCEDETSRALRVYAKTTPTESEQQPGRAVTPTNRQSHRSSCFAENCRPAAESLPAKSTPAAVCPSDRWRAARSRCARGRVSTPNDNRRGPDRPWFHPMEYSRTRRLRL